MTANGTGTLAVTGDFSIQVGTVAINSCATLLLGNGGSTNGTANQVGAITDNGALVFAVSGAAGQSGVISGTGSVTLSAGTLTLSQANTYTGGTTVNSGAILAGTGTQASTITASSGSTLAPGISSSSTGILTVNNGVMFDSGSTFHVALNGTTAGSNYDQLNVIGSSSTVTGTTTLGGTVGYAPAHNASFTIMKTAAASGITATFKDGFGNTLGNGSTVNLAGYNFTINGLGSSAVTLTFQNATTQTTVTSSVDPSALGQSVKFTATVTSTYGSSVTPTGTVTFFDGSTFLGTGVLGGCCGALCTMTTSQLPGGTHTITAVYSGTINLAGNTSPAFNQTVNKATTSTALAAAPNPSVFGQSVVFTATVTSSAGTPTGTVTFDDGAASIGTGLLRGGRATFVTTSLSAASHPITVVYGSDTNFAASTAANLTQTVNQAGTMTTLTTSPIAPVFSQSATFTATVTPNSPGSGTPTGNVTFEDGGTSFGTGMLSDGTATLTTTALSLTVNMHSLSAVYAGDSNFTTSTSAPLNLAFKGAVKITNPGTQNSIEGGNVTLGLSASDSTSGVTIFYDATNLPPGLFVDPSTGVISGAVAIGDAAGGPYTTNVSASDGSFTDSTSFTWNVTSPISWSPAIANQTNNEGDTINLPAAGTDSITGSTLTYSAVGLPSGLEINTGSGLITGTVGLGDSAAGPYSVTVCASDNTYSASQNFTWTINDPLTITQTPDQTNDEGDSPSVTVSAQASRPLVFGATGLPSGLSIGSSSGIITGTVAPGAAANGPYSVTVAASDSTYTRQRNFQLDGQFPGCHRGPCGPVQ